MNKIILILIVLIVSLACFSGCTEEKNTANNENNNDNKTDTTNENDDLDSNGSFTSKWKTSTVDDDGWVGIDPMIAVDKNNNPHIAYYDEGNENLKYAYFDGSNWNVETVDSNGDVGEEPGIDIDIKGNPHISYESHDASALYYATKNSEKWNITKIDSINTGIEAMSTSLKIDSIDSIHIAYSFGIDDGVDFDGYLFRYAYFNGSNWNIENVRKAGCDVIIDIDEANNPHISFKGDTGEEDRIMYAKKVSGEWSFEIVDDDVEADGDTGIAVQEDGTPHIVYHDYENGLIKYATKIDSKWAIDNIAEGLENQEGLKIDVDKDNVSHVVYSNCIGLDEEYLVYAKKEGKNWIKENVSFMGNPAIAVDLNGVVHIAHNACAEGNPKDYKPSYDGDDQEIEILKYSKRV
jgi:hypothetical protein